MAVDGHGVAILVPLDSSAAFGVIDTSVLDTNYLELIVLFVGVFQFVSV